MKNPPELVRRHLRTVVCFGVVMIACFVLLLKLSDGLPALGDRYTVKTILPTSGAQLVPGARVTLGGVAVGNVGSVERRGAGALVELELHEKSAYPLPSDSQVQLRQRTALGENYIALLWGTSKDSLADGGVIPISQAEEAVDVDDLLSVLKGRTRTRVRQLLRTTAATLGGRGKDLNQLLDGTGGTLEHGGGAVRQLVRDQVQIAQISAQLGDLASTIGERGEDIDLVARESQVALRAIADKDDRVRDLLNVLPGTLDQMRTTSGTLGRVSDQAAPVLGELATAVREVRPAARRLLPAATEGRSLVREIGATAPKLETVLAKARKLSPPTVRTLPRLRAVLCDVNPMLRYLQPYVKDVLNTLTGLNSATNAYDAIGHTIRLAPVLSDNSLAALPPDASRAARELLHAGLITEGSNDLNWNPYPKPGTAANGITPGEDFLGPDELADGRHYKYPRIVEDC